MKARKKPTDPRKKYSVKDDPTNPGMRNKGLKPLKDHYNVNVGDHWEFINKDGKRGQRYNVQLGPAAIVNERPLTYKEVRATKLKKGLR